MMIFEGSGRVLNDELSRNLPWKYGGKPWKDFLKTEGVPAEIDNANFSLKEVGYERVKWISTAKNRDQKWILVNTIFLAFKSLNLKEIHYVC